jgi:hypothetical protein
LTPYVDEFAYCIDRNNTKSSSKSCFYQKLKVGHVKWLPQKLVFLLDEPPKMIKGVEKNGIKRKEIEGGVQSERSAYYIRCWFCLKNIE